MCSTRDFSSQVFKWFEPKSPFIGYTAPPKLFEIPDESKDIASTSTIKELPLFPFDFGSAFPTGQFPLNIFVMHFRQMMNDIQFTDKLFGIVISDGEGRIGITRF